VSQLFTKAIKLLWKLIATGSSLHEGGARVVLVISKNGTVVLKK